MHRNVKRIYKILSQKKYNTFCSIFVLWSSVILLCSYWSLNFCGIAFGLNKITSHLKHDSTSTKSLHVKQQIKVSNLIAKKKRYHIKYNHSSNFIYQDKYAGLVVDENTGMIIYECHAKQLRYPASLVKMMTLYLTFDAIENGNLNPRNCVYISYKASRQEPSNLSLSRGDCIPLVTAINAIVVKSANDVAWALAEAISGNVAKFVNLMNKKAHQLGMYNTVFSNPNGLHNNSQVTTAYDMARLALALRKNHGRYYNIFKQKYFIFRGKKIHGHNHLLHKYYGADGLKTGYTSISGFNIVTSTKRKKGNLIGVVMGGNSASARDHHMMRLLDYAYAKLNVYHNTSHKYHNNNSIIQKRSSDVTENNNYINIYDHYSTISNGDIATNRTKMHNMHTDVTTKIRNENAFDVLKIEEHKKYISKQKKFCSTFGRTKNVKKKL